MLVLFIYLSYYITETYTSVNMTLPDFSVTVPSIATRYVRYCDINQGNGAHPECVFHRLVAKKKDTFKLDYI